MWQQLRETAQYENARIAAGITLPYDDERLEDELLHGFAISILQVEYRFDQLFRIAEKTDVSYCKRKPPLHTSVFAAVSRLVETQPMENVRADAEVAVTVRPGETYQQAFDRAFQEVGQALQRALKEGKARDGSAKAKKFEWQ